MKAIITLAAALALCAAAGTASGQNPTVKTSTKAAVHKTKKTETQADLMKEAKISMDSARTIALAKVPGATVEASEIERENGRLIYSFDLKRAGRTGIDEVNVNALTGKIVGGVQHESPKTEKTEAKVEATGKKRR